ncbi:peptidylprolyl isomerase [Vogesella indigofera]|uniref:peptidylprolyl isomerase n=1 Tax=Vogesella indigofera TaxID=45465 RepID=UPI00177A4BB7
MKKSLTIAALLLAAVGSTPSLAAPVATVNGSAIDSSTLDQAVKQVIGSSNGQLKDSPALREEVRQRLINRELIVQAATKAGLDKKPEFQQQLTEARTELLQQAFFKQSISTSPVSDSALKAAYQQYSERFNGVKEVKVRQIIVNSEADANSVLAELKKGAKFETLAASKSIHQPSRERGGDLGWGNLASMEPPLAAALQAIPKGKFSAQPLRSGLGWHLFKVEDIRDAKPLPFDTVKPQIARDLQDKAISDAIGELRQKANIQ